VKKFATRVSFSALLELADTLRLNRPVAFGNTVQFTALNSPTAIVAISSVLFGSTAQLFGRFSVTFTSSAVSMNEFRVAFTVKGWYCSVSFGVSTASTSMFALHPGNCIVMFSCGETLSL